MRLAMVVQRYGDEVDGGAEAHCRSMATHLAARGHQVSVLTTTARDYLTWANHYQPGESEQEGVRLLRFPVARRRWVRPFNIWARKVYRGGQPIDVQWRWLLRQGPYAPALIDHLLAHEDDFQAIIFYTYLYFPTAAGLPLASRRALLVPTAHDDPTLPLPVFRPVFHSPRCIIYNSEAERDLVWRVTGNSWVPSRVVALGIDPPAAGGGAEFRARHGLEGDFLLYLGRVDVMKGCREMFDYFTRLTSEPAHKDLKLVLVGRRHMELPSHPGILSLGFVDQAERDAALEAATALVMPSPYESLSMVTLEASAAGRPVVVNSQCDVLARYVERTGAGLAYHDYEGFRAALERLRSRPGEAAAMGEKGAAFVAGQFGWEPVLKVYEEVLASVAAGVPVS
ncbi:MAG: glycosyltransferase family 4 protein [Desulfarculaceae bacterium]|nr:glycosyltransferase family 4 protein [Desulfarculaceae bacterium]MCF8072503.1 glycosyltransferase family 4 protein [Desulfarculaceae bacterium]MCF8103644.1 glycosyltransferase family 4 protein [Desulfarculaceae bacterium]MCF8117044.1 glycosyltransferase family 4 protein [Desulfarculaceae bacterium]